VFYRTPLFFFESSLTMSAANRNLPDIDAIMSRELRPGEQLRWVGQPVPMSFAMSSLRPAVALAAVLAGGAIVLYFVASIAAFVVLRWESPGDISIAIGGGLFIAAFAVTLLFVFLRAYKEAQTMAYAITDERAVVIYRSPHLQIDSYGPYGVWDIHVLPAWGNTAHLIFAKDFMNHGYLKVGTDIRGTRRMTRRPAIRQMKIANPALPLEPSTPDGVGFYAISNAYDVATILQGTLKSEHSN
jgi:hypothetical protein